MKGAETAVYTLHACGTYRLDAFRSLSIWIGCVPSSDEAKRQIHRSSRGHQNFRPSAGKCLVTARQGGHDRIVALSETRYQFDGCNPITTKGGLRINREASRATARIPSRVPLEHFGNYTEPSRQAGWPRAETRKTDNESCRQHLPPGALSADKIDRSSHQSDKLAISQEHRFNREPINPQ